LETGLLDKIAPLGMGLRIFGILGSWRGIEMYRYGWVLVLLSMPAWADQVTLKNGD